jgi:hypothetical protein
MLTDYDFSDGLPTEANRKRPALRRPSMATCRHDAPMTQPEQEIAGVMA